MDQLGVHLVHVIISRHASQDKKITVKVIRNGLPEPRDNDWSKATPGERVEAVWMLTKTLLGLEQSFRERTTNAKHVTRVIRGKREDQETTN